VQFLLAFASDVGRTEQYAAPENFLELSPPWEANRPSANQEIPHVLCNPNVHYRIHNSSQRLPILSLIIPVHNSPSHFLKIYINIVLSSTPGSSKWSLSLRYLHQNPVCTSPVPHTCHMPRPSHFSWLDHPNNIWWEVQMTEFSIMLSDLPPITSSYLDSNILLSTLFPNTLPQCERQMFRSHNKQKVKL